MQPGVTMPNSNTGLERQMLPDAAYTPFQAKYFAHFLTRESVSEGQGLAQSLSAARVDLKSSASNRTIAASARQDDHTIDPHRPRAPQAGAPAQTSGRLNHSAI